MAVLRSPHPDVPLRDVSITDALFEGLTGRPDEVVLVDGPSEREMTAGELTDGIRRLAGGLAARGVGPGYVVALMAPNMPDYAIAFHGPLYAGATVTTVNPTYTASELRHQLTDSGARLLITIPAFLPIAREAVAGTAVTEIVVIGEAEGATPLASLMGEPSAAQVAVDLAGDTAVLPYSSGTTGMPKGVMLTHRNLVANIDQSVVAVPMRPGEWTVAFLPFFHIYGQTVLLNLYLAKGGRVVTMPRFDLAQFLGLVSKYRTRRLWTVPPVAIALAKHPLVDQFDLSGVEMVFTAAAPADRSLTDAVARRLGVIVTQGYGMTELSPVCHMSSAERTLPGSVGQLAPSTEGRIVDPETGEDCPAGVQGEVWIRGPQVMKGYLGRPEATAATITADGWLRTGDLGTVDEDGYLFVQDRLKELIKVKGFQVAPAEVEAALLDCPGITDAGVRGLPDDEAGEVPVAWIVATDGALSDAAILGHLQGRLSGYKHPRRIHRVDAVPKSASGKILRRMLSEPI